MLKATLKALLAHKLRFALTAVAVLLGVTFVSGTYAFTDTMDDVFNTMITDATAGVDVYVQPKTSFESTSDFGTASPGFDEKLVTTVKDIDGVDAAEGTVAGYAQFVDKEGKAITPIGPPTLGMSWTEDEGLSSLEITRGRPPVNGSEVAMDAATAEEHGFRVGDEVDILLLGPQKTFELVGTFDREGSSGFAGATLAAFDLETAQQVFDKRGLVDAVEVAAVEGLTEEDLRARVSEALPSTVEAKTAAALTDQQTDTVADSIGFFTTVLLVFAAIAVFVGAFIIFNTFSITVSQRLREFGLLRAIGASGRQVLASVVGEATIVGIVASLVGIFAGLGAAVGLAALMNAFGMDLPSQTPTLQPRTIAVALTVGMGVTVVSALVPALRAARTPPIEAMHDVHSAPPRVRRRRVMIAAGISLLGAGGLATGLFVEMDQPLILTGAGAVLLFLGVAMMAPLLAKPVTGLLAAPLPKLFGITGGLARENAMRSPRRTASTAAALMVGLAVVTIVSVFGSSLKASVNVAINEGVKAELVLMPKSSMSMQSFSPEIARRVQALPEINVAAPFRMGEWKNSDGGRRTTMGIDPDKIEDVLDLDVVAGSLKALRDGGILLKDTVADDLSLAVGDTLEMTFPATGKQDVRVDAIYDAVIDDEYLLSLTTYEANYPKQQDIQVYLDRANWATPAEAKAAVEDVLTEFPNVDVLTREELRGEVGSIVDRLLNMVFALLGLTLVIAMMGITNTLALSIHERRRELGLLRAVGATQRQIRRMIRWEAATVSMFGTILGITLGCVISWALITSLEDVGFRKLQFPVVQLLGFVVVAAVAGLLAAVLPARRAAKVDVLKAVAVE